jgi:drug/metabolite transporter superfamily protein YnfA
MSTESRGEFEKLAGQRVEGSFLGEFWLFLRHNKKWWLLPILLTILMFALLALFSGTGAAPFIYTLF